MIILEDVMLGGCSVYEPRTTDFMGRPLPRGPQYYVWFSKGANGHLDVEWTVPKREDRQPTKSYRSTIPPLVTMKDHDYSHLIKQSEIATVRNIPLDMMFKDTVVDIQLSDDGFLIGIVSDMVSMIDIGSFGHD